MMQTDYTRIPPSVQPTRGWVWGLCALFVFSLNPALAQSAVPADNPAAVIYAYQRVGDDSMPHASLSLAQFTAQINQLKRGAYIVKPMAEVMTALKNGEALPPKTVALTFDGAHKPTLERVAPILEKADYPYTVFYSSNAVDKAEGGSLNWDELRALRKNKNVELGILPARYTHLVAEDMATATAAINTALGRYREEFGTDPAYFAWPYGEYSLALKNKLAEYNFVGAFGYHAGVVHATSDFLALPRFVMNDLTGDIDRFNQTATSLPLPVTDVSPEDPVLKDNPPMIGFTVMPEIRTLDRMACFVSGQGKVNVRRVAGNRIELRPEKPFTNRRTRVNCTLPDDVIVPGEETPWRWLGLVFIDPEYTEIQPISDTSGFE